MEIKVSIGIKNDYTTYYEDIIISDADIIELAKSKMKDLYYGESEFIYEKIDGIDY